MLRFWRGIAVVAFSGGILAAGQLPSLDAVAATGPAITISATSKFAAVSGDVFVVLHAGKYAKATIQGDISNAASGEVAVLFARQFPGTAAPVNSGSVALTGPAQSYSFTVKPGLATAYQVELFQDSTLTAVLTMSPAQSIYTMIGGGVTGVRTCGRPVCHETLSAHQVLPAAAVKEEMSKHVYAYFGVNLGATKIPKPPAWVHLGAGDARVSKPHQVSKTAYDFKIRYSFRIGNHAYYWLWTACQKDSEAKDGLGLPGTHSCGAKRVRPNAYLG